jgi:hypothetical protein
MKYYSMDFMKAAQASSALLPTNGDGRDNTQAG